MTKAIFFGSIGTLVETSAMQLAAFNQTFSEAGLPWVWSREEYRQMLRNAGGQKRIDEYASSKGVDVDAEALHKRKSAIFKEFLLEEPLNARLGVKETIQYATDGKLKLGLVTTTSRDNVDSILRSLDISWTQFDVVTTCETVARPKPAGDAYTAALDYLQLDPDQVIAVEDNPDGATSAIQAGLRCIGLIGEMHTVSGFPAVVAHQTSLDVRSYLEMQPAN